MKMVTTTDARGNTSSRPEYSDAELAEAWFSGGQGNHQAQARGEMCVVQEHVSFTEALILSRLFVMVFAIPSCVHYDSRSAIISFYCGDAGRSGLTLKATVHGILMGFIAGKALR